MLRRATLPIIVLLALSGCAEITHPDGGRTYTATEPGWYSDNPQGKDVYEAREVRSSEVQWTLDGRGRTDPPPPPLEPAP